MNVTISPSLPSQLTVNNGRLCWTPSKYAGSDSHLRLNWTVNNGRLCWTPSKYAGSDSHLRLNLTVNNGGLCWTPSKYAGSDSHLIWISWKALTRGWPDDSCTPARSLPDQIRLAKPWHSPPEPNWIRASFHNMIWAVCGRMQTESESGKLVAGWLRSARTGPDDSCTLACFHSSGPDAFGQNPGQFCAVWSGPSFKEQNQIWCEKSDQIQPDSGRTLAVILIAITGCNQNVSESDAACLQGSTDCALEV